MAQLVWGSIPSLEIHYLHLLAFLSAATYGWIYELVRLHATRLLSTASLQATSAEQEV
jgi:hypothetical protein